MHDVTRFVSSSKESSQISLTYLQLSLYPPFASFPKGYLRLIVLCHDFHKLPGQNGVLWGGRRSSLQLIHIQKSQLQTMKMPVRLVRFLFADLSFLNPEVDGAPVCRVVFGYALLHGCRHKVTLLHNNRLTIGSESIHTTENFTNFSASSAPRWRCL